MNASVGREARVDTFSCGIPGVNGYTSMTVTDTVTGRKVSGAVQHSDGSSFGLRERLFRELFGDDTVDGIMARQWATPAQADAGAAI